MGGGAFTGVGSYATYWTATQWNESDGLRRFLGSFNPSAVERGGILAINWISLRCLQD